MNLSPLKIWPLAMCCVILASCVNTSTWLSGDSPSKKDFLYPSSHFASIQTGVSTKEEVEAKFGNPTRQDIHTLDGFTSEVVSYSTSETTMQPYQYLPFLGAFAFQGLTGNPTPSAAISFSSDKRVSGLTVSTVNAYGDIRSSEDTLIMDSPNSFYGMRNPNVFHPFVESIP